MTFRHRSVARTNRGANRRQCYALLSRDSSYSCQRDVEILVNVVAQRFEEWRTGRKRVAADTAPAE